MNQNINDFKFCRRCGTRLPKSAVICYRCDMKQEIYSNMPNSDSGVNLSKDETVQDVSFREVESAGKTAVYSDSAAKKEKIDVTNTGVIVLIGIAVAAAALFVSMVMMINRDGEFYDEYRNESKTSSVETIEDRDEETERREESSTYDAGWDEISNDGVYEAGTYEIGTEIPDGIYIVVANDNDTNTAYQAIYADRDQEEQKSGEWFKHSTIVSVRGDGYFSTIRGTAYNIDSFDMENDPFEHEGMFRVGVDLAPGTYHAVSSSSDDSFGMWTVHDSVYEIDYDKIYYDGNFDDHAENLEITVKEGQVLQLKNCHLIK